MRVSVVIPTFNSARTIKTCLESITLQTFSDIEIIVVDSFSSDGTTRIAKEHAEVLSIDSGIAKARYEGALRASGTFVLNLDSDQALRPSAIQKAINLDLPIVAFGEASEGTGLVTIINRLDQLATDSKWMDNLDPIRGPIRPRFYERSLLLKALEEIPPNFRNLKPSPFSEDSLIYFNAFKLEQRVGFVPSAVIHLENPSLLAYTRKWYGYGRSARAYRGTPYEPFATQRGERRGRMRNRVMSLPARLMKGVPFALGYFV